MKSSAVSYSAKVWVCSQTQLWSVRDPTTNVNQYDQTLNDENLLLQIGKNLELLSNYKDLKPLPRALIPDKHQIYGITIYKDGSITAQSCVAYLLSTPKKVKTSNFKPTISP